MRVKSYLVTRLSPFGIIALILTGCESIQSLLPSLPPLPSLSQNETPAPTPSSSQTAEAQSPETGEMEQQVWQQINEIRLQQGLAPLENNPKLAQVARDYSRRMAEQKFFSHTSPQGDTVVERVQDAGIFYIVIGENLFTSTNIPQPATPAVEGWMNSSGHRENILRPEFRETGIGVWREGNSYYFTQLFLRSFP